MATSPRGHRAGPSHWAPPGLLVGGGGCPVSAALGGPPQPHPGGLHLSASAQAGLGFPPQSRTPRGGHSPGLGSTQGGARTPVSWSSPICWPGRGSRCPSTQATSRPHLVPAHLSHSLSQAQSPGCTPQPAPPLPGHQTGGPTGWQWGGGGRLRKHKLQPLCPGRPARAALGASCSSL